MDNQDKFTDGVFKSRPVLMDVTNRRAKRPFSGISGDDEELQFTKQVCLGPNNVVEKKNQLQFGAQCQPNDKGKKILLQPNEKQKRLCFNVPFCGDTLLSSQNCENEEQHPLGVEKCASDRAIESCDNNLESVEWPTIPSSFDPKFVGLERCSGLKGDGNAHSVTDGGDLIKSCTCSFCSKAAYIWTDLHYQDVKGRFSALKKIQKEARAIIHKFSGLKDTVVLDQHTGAGSSELESSLMHQWKSLYVHMENIYAQEISQLDSSFETLKDLRESCKNDLELNDNSHHDSH